MRNSLLSRISHLVTASAHKRFGFRFVFLLSDVQKIHSPRFRAFALDDHQPCSSPSLKFPTPPLEEGPKPIKRQHSGITSAQGWRN